MHVVSNAAVSRIVPFHVNISFYFLLLIRLMTITELKPIY